MTLSIYVLLVIVDLRIVWPWITFEFAPGGLDDVKSIRSVIFMKTIPITGKQL